MTLSCGEYVWAIPDYSSEARRTDRGAGRDNASIATSRSQKSKQGFKKVIMKLSGNVRWLSGLVFERNTDGQGRSFDFIPHYDITLRTPEHVKSMNRGVRLEYHAQSSR